MTDTNDDDLGFHTLAFDDIRRWHAALKVVDGVIASLRAARSDEDVQAATRELHLAMARARDFESNAIHLMRRYGYADGVDVPEIGRVRVRWLEDWTKVLEFVTQPPAGQAATEREVLTQERTAGEHPIDRVYGILSRPGMAGMPIDDVDSYIDEIRGRR